MAAYHVLVDGEWFAPKRRGHRHMCCDCHAAHRIDLAIKMHGKRQVIVMRFTRDKRVTALARRNKKKK